MTNFAEMALVRSMSFLAEKQSAVSHNLANVGTDSFKRQASVALSTQSTFEGELGLQLPEIIYSEVTDWSPGTLRQTGSRNHLSIEGDGYLRVRDRNGTDFLTRRGTLEMDSQGYLITPGGERYLDENNEPIQIGSADVPAQAFSISPDGTITEDGGEGRTFGRLSLVAVPDRGNLQPYGGGLFRDIGKEPPVPDLRSSVKQGSLEGANVNTVDELVQMLEVQRAFQATQKALSGIGRLQASYIQMMNR